ncbi:MAG TPA: hypothetical protein VMH86_11355 [Rhizomicrobium sp.]|nr:hypothetical protein [Rhizomicrobium sp.]
MTLARTIEVVVRLSREGVIGNYAIAGAVAALNYIEPTFTEDLDILISVEAFENRQSGLLLLGPIEAGLARMGYTRRSDVGYEIEGWPVQFLPVASPLDEEALAQAVEIDLGDGITRARCLRAEHIVAIALKVGRPKDFARIESFLEHSAVDLRALNGVLERHNLMASWRAWCLKAGRKDALADERRT